MADEELAGCTVELVSGEEEDGEEEGDEEGEEDEEESEDEEGAAVSETADGVAGAA